LAGVHTGERDDRDASPGLARYVIGFGLQLGEKALTSQATDDDLSALYRPPDPPPTRCSARSRTSSISGST